MIKREKSFSFCYYVHYPMINREKKFLSFSHYVQFFFHLVTTFTTPWSRKKKKFFFIWWLRSLRHDQEKKDFFSFSHNVHYAMIKREKSGFFHLVTKFTTPWQERKKVFFHLVTTFTTPWSRGKNFFFLISALHSLRHGHKKNKLIFISPLPWLRYDHKKISFFHFTTTFTTQIYSYVSLRC